MSYVLHGYFRSTASWRVRIGLALKGIAYDHVSHHLRRKDHHAPGYLALNPQGLVPALELGDGVVLTQSLAICEYLDELHPAPPLLPTHPVERAQARAFAQAIACDIHPVQNLKVLNRVRALMQDEDAVSGWARDVIDEGLEACAKLLEGRPRTDFCFGDTPGMADLCLIPQLSNARRFGVGLRWPRLLEIEQNCLALPAFQVTAPENQPDAE